MALFGSPKPANYAVIDIGSSSVGAAYVSAHEGEAPLIAHALRVPLEGEATTAAIRALDKALKQLITEGASKLHQLGGHAGLSGSLVYIGAPWQQSELIVRTTEKEKPFMFTKGMLEEALATAPGGKSMVVASLMNGYETSQPIGKKAKRADIIVLASHVEVELFDVIRKAVRGATGGVPMRVVSFGELAPPAVLSISGGEDEFLALRVTRNAASLAFVKKRLLAGVRSLDIGTSVFLKAAREGGVSLPTVAEGLIDKDKNGRLASRIDEAERGWLLRMRETLRELAAGRALPRALFLFADGPDAHFVSRLLNSPEIHDLWLSDEPLAVVAVTPEHFDPYLHRGEGALQDPFLDALALIAAHS